MATEPSVGTTTWKPALTRSKTVLGMARFSVTPTTTTVVMPSFPSMAESPDPESAESPWDRGTITSASGSKASSGAGCTAGVPTSCCTSAFLPAAKSREFRLPPHISALVWNVEWMTLTPAERATTARPPRRGSSPAAATASATAGMLDSGPTTPFWHSTMHNAVWAGETSS